MVNRKHGFIAMVFALLALLFVSCASAPHTKDMDMKDGMKNEKEMTDDKMMNDDKMMKDDKMMGGKKS